MTTVTRAPASSWWNRRRPLLPLGSEAERLLHRVSLVWAWFAIVALEIAGWAGWLAHRPGTETFEIAVRPLFLALFAVGALLAWRWTVAGGLIATFTAAGILVWEGQQLQPAHAVIVVGLFAVPGIAWLLLDLHSRRRGVAIVGLALALIAGSGGFAVATNYYDQLFGPSHPESVATLPNGSAVDWIWTGGVTTDAATVVAAVDDDEPWIARFRDDTGAVAAEVAAVSDRDGIVRFHATGLLPDTAYSVEIVGDRETDGIDEARFRTFPTGSADLVLALGSCMRVGTNGAVFDAIRAVTPDLFVIDGDFHYANIGDADPDAFREVMGLNLSEPGPSALFRSVPIGYVWDDHDYGGNNGDSTSPTRSTALSVYRQLVPSYLSNGPDDPIYQAFDIGDVRVILTDVRSARSPAEMPDDEHKTMLGSEQRDWLLSELLAARDTHALTIWVNPVPWIGEATPGGDSWDGYTTERATIADFIAANGIDRLLMLSGDAHMVAIDDGSNSGYATDGTPGFPVLHAGALDRPGHEKGGPYSEGAVPGGGQFGVVEIEHTDAGLHVRLSGRDWTGSTLLSYEFEVPGR